MDHMSSRRAAVHRVSPPLLTQALTNAWREGAHGKGLVLLDRLADELVAPRTDHEHAAAHDHSEAMG